jgi:hypothetical protein
MTVWSKDQESLDAALPELAQAVEYANVKPTERKLILKEIV